MLTATVRLDLRRLQKFQSAIGEQTSNPRIARALKQWAARYRGFARARFARLSKSNGGGIWPPLAASTIRQRRPPSRGRKHKSSASRLVSILWDTGLLIGALDPMNEGAPGALVKYKPFSVLVGYGGPQLHGTTGKATISDIANFHQTGAGHLPKREIIVPPDAHTLKLMANDMNKAMRETLKDCGF